MDGQRNIALHHWKLFEEAILPKAQRKESTGVLDIILTSNKYHGSYEKYVGAAGVAKIKKLLNGFLELVSMDGTVDEGHIREVFGAEASGIFALWKKEGNFNKNLDIFNERRRDLRNDGPAEFLKDTYGKCCPLILH